MLRTEEMSELSLLVRRQHIEDVTRAIASEGVLHQVDTSYLSREEEWDTEPWDERIQQYQGLEQRLVLMMDALHIPEIPPVEGVVTEVEGDLSTLRDRLLRVEQDVMPLVNELRSQQSRLNELEALLGRLQPIADLSVDLAKLRNLTFLHAQIGIVPSGNLDRFNASLLHVPHVLVTLGEQGAGVLVALFGSAKDGEILERAAHSAYMSPISMPEGYRGTPSTILNTLQEEIADLRGRRTALDERARIIADMWGETLRNLLQRVRNDLKLLRAIDRFGQVRDVYLIAGWVPTRRISAIIDAAQRITHGEVAVDITPAEQSGDLKNVPTTLNHKGMMSAFQTLVTNYSFPSYNELDPTPLVAATFVLMFGIMFGDVGHGLVLALVGLAGMKKWVSALAGLGDLAVVLFTGGLSAAFFGILYGSVFGVENVFPPLWLRPLENIMTILVVSIGLGVLLTSFAFAANIINGIWAHDRRRALFDRFGLAGAWFYFGFIGLVAALLTRQPIPGWLGLVLLGPPLLMITFGEPLDNLISGHRPLINEGWGIYLVETFFETFEALIGYLSNSLSWVRLGAFAVAHGGLSAVFFILARMIGGDTGSVMYWVIVAGGNIFVIGFEGLIVGIQTLRLEYYELLSRFFRGGGVPYKPLRFSEDKR